MQRMRRFSKYWELVGNSGNFKESCALLWSESGMSAFNSFLMFSDWLYNRLGRTDSIALARLMELFFEYLTIIAGITQQRAAGTLFGDYQRAGRRDMPEFLRPHLPREPKTRSRQVALTGLPRRQARHL